MTAPLVELTEIHKSFGANPVLKGVNLELQSGEVHALAGGNGAGKSTLINILGGNITDYTGTIRIDGESKKYAAAADAIRGGIVVIHQELSLIPTLSVVENLFLGDPLTKRGLIDRKAMEAEAARILKRFEIDVDLRAPVQELPLSTRQLVEIAKGLRHKARVVVMDEPTSALNEIETQRLFGIIAELQRQGSGVLYISHRMEEIAQIATRVSVLRDGQIVATGTPRELTPDVIAAHMVGKPLEEVKLQVQADANMVGEVLLNAEEINFSRAGQTVVDHISIQVRAGEVVGLAGLEGAGASEVLWTLFGAHQKGGSCKMTLKGNPVDCASPKKSKTAGLALVTNDRKTTGLVLCASIEENAALPSHAKYARFGWLNTKAMLRAMDILCRSFAVKSANFSEAVSSLSGGNQQKVVLAKWHHTNPDVILLDEPTRGIDVHAKVQIYEQILKWKREGKGLLLISSDIHELILLSDRIEVMKQGKVVRQFSREDATAESVMRATISA